MSIRIIGKKVVLRDLNESDIYSIWHWNFEAIDREHTNWNGPYKPLENKPFESFREKYLEDLSLMDTNNPRSVLVIEIDGELKGTVGRYWVDRVTNWLEIGIVIYDSHYWSGGYGSEAFQLWIDYLFQSMDIVRLGISTWSGNERMIKLAKNVGMIDEACIRKARIVRGEYYDSIKMGILREEWAARIEK